MEAGEDKVITLRTRSKDSILWTFLFVTVVAITIWIKSGMENFKEAWYFGIFILTAYGMGLAFLPRYRDENYRLFLYKDSLNNEEGELFKWSDVTSIRLKRVRLDTVLVITAIIEHEFILWTKKERVALIQAALLNGQITTEDIYNEAQKNINFQQLTKERLKYFVGIDVILRNITPYLVIILLLILFISTEFHMISRLWSP